jgi:hypothetical protein
MNTTTKTPKEKYEAKQALQIAIQATKDQQIMYANVMSWTQMSEEDDNVFEHPTSWDVLYLSEKDFDYSELFDSSAYKKIASFFETIRQNPDKYSPLSNDLLSLPIGLPIETYVIQISAFLDKLILLKK